MQRELGGIKASGRKYLGSILKAYPAGFTVEEAILVLGLTRIRTTALLSSWQKQGWLYRVKRGFYIPVPFESSTIVTAPLEPWLIAHKLFSPCCIAGWTAAHHWGFTEQLFIPIYVCTVKSVHQRDQTLEGVSFKIKTIQQDRLFATQNIWVGAVKVAISDPTKTIIDGLNDPNVLGGLRMLTDILDQYIYSEHFDEKKLIAYAQQMGNSAILKRLGFLMECISREKFQFLIQQCKSSIKSGYSQLDPNIKGDRLNTHWNLWISSTFQLENTL